MSCNPCNTICPITTRTSEVTVGSHAVYLMFTGFDFSTFTNLQHFNFYICQNIPAEACVLPVLLSDGTNYIPLRVVSGNNAHADQLRTRKLYYTIYGNDEEHFSLRCKVPNTGYVVESTSLLTEAPSVTAKATTKSTS